MLKRLIAGTVCAGLFCAAGSPALADGAASTRNIIFGAAAAGVGTWAIVNHNKKVHQKIDEKDAQIHSLDQQRTGAEASYSSEHQAYLHAVAVANHYMAEAAALKRQIAAQRGPVSQSGAATSGTQSTMNLASVSYGWGQP
jgi:hypothetical protein